MTKDSERNFRPTLALERSPYYEDLVLTIHDFHFAIWKTSIDTQETPIFRSSNTFGSHNTCGCFSPTRPGVVFITKTDGIDVWDFVDQSNKPSLTLTFATSAITYFKIQVMKEDRKTKQRKQYMAYGDQTEGTLYLYEVPHNLAEPLENELQTIDAFWTREVEKCDYVKARRVTMKEEWQENETKKAVAAALAEAEKDKLEDAEVEKELAEEEAYQELLLQMKVKLGLLNEDELDAIQ